MKIFDDKVPLKLRLAISQQLEDAKWSYGWKSNPKIDKFSFFHAHFGGSEEPDHDGAKQHDCSTEISASYPDLFRLWIIINQLVPNQTLVRCYANGYPYGCDGTLHTDSVNPRSITWIYYPHEQWDPNWGGETVFFKGDEIVNAIYPKPGRIIGFEGTIPHIGRGVTRQCPVIRVTLMFKSELRNGSA